MRNRRQARTARNVRKGKKLQGLTQWEAKQRAVKGWRTKRAHGFRAKTSRVEEGGEPPFRGRRRPIDPTPFSRAIDPSELHMGESAAEYFARVAEETRKESPGVGTEEFKRQLRGIEGLSESDRRLLITQIEKQESQAKALRRAEAVRETARTGRPSRFDPKLTEDAELKSNMQRLHQAVNKTPLTQGVKEEGIDVRPEGVLTRSGRLAPEQVERRIREGQITEGDLSVRRRPVTQEEIHREASKAIVDSFNYRDPVSGHTAGLIRQSEADAWVRMVERSYFAPTEVERRRASNAAISAANRFSQRAQKHLDTRREVARIAEMEGILAPETVAEAQTMVRGEGRHKPLFRTGQSPKPGERGKPETVAFQRMQQSLARARSIQAELGRKKSLNQDEFKRLVAAQEAEKQLAGELEAYHGPRREAQQERRKAYGEIKDLQDRISQTTEPRERQALRKQLHDARKRAGVPSITPPSTTSRLLDEEGKIIPGYKPTVGDLYDIYGHEKAPAAVRTRYNIAKLRGKEVSEKPPPYFYRARQQAKFTQDQIRGKFKAIVSGSYQGAWNRQGRVGEKEKNVGLKMGPANQDWTRIDTFGNNVRFKPGKRELITSDKPLQPFESHEEIVALPGLKRTSSKTVKAKGKGVYEQKQVTDAWGRFRDATDTEYELAKNQEGIGRQKVQVPKAVRVTYASPEEARLLRNERDQLSFRIPGGVIKRPAGVQTGIAGGLAVPYGIKTQPTRVRVGDRQVSVGLPDSRLSRIAFAYPRARQARELRERSVVAARKKQAEQEARLFDESPEFRRSVIALTEKRIKQGEPVKGGDQLSFDDPKRILADVGAAGLAASYLHSKKEVTQGHLPQLFNRGYARFLHGHPRAMKFAKSKSLENFKLDVNEGYVRPGIEKAANLKWGLEHPFSSLSGTTGGLDFGRELFYRKRFINPDKLRARQIRMHEEQIGRVVRTQEFISRNIWKGTKPEDSLGDKISGALARHRAAPALRHKDYTNFYEQNGLLAEATRVARDVMRDSESGSETYRAAAHLHAVARHLVAGERNRRLDQINPRTGQPFSKALVHVPRSTTRWDRYAAGQFSRNEKAFAAGVGVLAVAGAGAYGVHKWRERKKPKEERRAFYNKALPPAFGIPAPHAHVTGRYVVPHNFVTEEFQTAGKKLPVRWGVGIKEKTIALRPEDRGYPSNAKLGITGFRPGLKRRRGEPKGSLVESMFFAPPRARRQRSWRPEGRQLVVKGHPLPIRADIGKAQKIKLSRTNPRRLTAEDRENIVWAFKGTPHEADIKNFYSFGREDRVLDMFDDPEVVRRIRKKKDEKEIKDIISRYGEGPTARLSEEEVGIPRRGYGDVIRFGEPRRAEEEAWSAKPRSYQGQMATGGTGGVEPFSQVGQRRTKVDERFNTATGQWELYERPVGGIRIRPEDIPAEKVERPGYQRRKKE